MARCMATRTSTARPDSPWSQMYRSGTSSTSRHRHRRPHEHPAGRDDTRVTTGQPTQAMSTPIDRQLGVVPELRSGRSGRCRGTRPCPRPPMRRRPPAIRRRPPPRPGPSEPTRAGGRRARSRCGTGRGAARGRCRPPGSDDRGGGVLGHGPQDTGRGRGPVPPVPAPAGSARPVSRVDSHGRRVRPGRRRRPPR